MYTYVAVAVLALSSLPLFAAHDGDRTGRFDTETQREWRSGDSRFGRDDRYDRDGRYDRDRHYDRDGRYDRGEGYHWRHGRTERLSYRERLRYDYLTYCERSYRMPWRRECHVPTYRRYYGYGRVAIYDQHGHRLR
ncbi:MAG TPA: hypothetical protein VEK08_03315 [Planctomycetota bacterium]|nr:hypothetical protein [Planctomycetota bacterium]